MANWNGSGGFGGAVRALWRAVHVLEIPVLIVSRQAKGVFFQEAGCEAGLQERDDSDFLKFETDTGRADFHALRHTFISNLAASGVHPKLAKELARHSTITLTMHRYAHVGLLDMNSALESLPDIPEPSETQRMALTGTSGPIVVAPMVATNQCSHRSYQGSPLISVSRMSRGRQAVT